MGIFKGKRKKGLKLASDKKRKIYNVRQKRRRIEQENFVKKHSSANYPLNTNINSSTFTYDIWSNDCMDTLFTSNIPTTTCNKNNCLEEDEILSSLDCSFESLDITDEEIEGHSPYDDISSLLPVVLEQMEKVGKGDILLKFLNLMNEGHFPTNNIAFSLFCDVVEWFSKDDSRHMRYSDSTLQFFWIGRKLFGGRFLRFMSGMKNETDQLTNATTHFDPLKSRINFACPSESILRDLNPFGNDLPVTFESGIMEKMIEYKAIRNEDSKTYVLMFDGKKIKRGADVDLLGFEKGMTLQHRQEVRDQDIEALRSLEISINQIQETTNDVSLTPEDMKANVLNQLKAINIILSRHLQELRNLKCKKEYALSKLMEKVDGVDWGKSKFAFSIDLCKTNIWKIENVIEQITNFQKCLCKTGAFVNGVGHLYAKSNIINLENQQNLRILKSPEKLPSTCSVNVSDLATVKQRSEKWFKERSKMKVTGSTIYRALGCDGLKFQKEHFDSVVSGISPPEVSPTQAAAMKHGTDSEIHQIATMCSIIMPFFFPKLVFYEEGSYITNNVLVSPDGSLRLSENKNVKSFAFEGKAPTGNTFKPALHNVVPERYIAQTLFEQKALDATDGTLYMSWTSTSCTLFKVLSNEEAINTILRELTEIYFCDKLKRPTRSSPAAKQIKQYMQEISRTGCVFLGEFPTVQGKLDHDETTNGTSAHIDPIPSDDYRDKLTYDEVHRHILQGKDTILSSYEILRIIASQVVVYLLADLDRLWKEEEPHAIPIAYFFRGYSLSMDVFRSITEECKDKCLEKGIDVIVSAADGEFLPLIVRGRKGNPLTQHQLSKDVWTEVSKLSKHQILQKLKDATKEYVFDMSRLPNEPNCAMKPISLQSKNKALSRICTPMKGWQREQKPQNNKVTTEENCEIEQMLESEARQTELEEEQQIESNIFQMNHISIDCVEEENPDVEVSTSGIQENKAESLGSILSLCPDAINEFLESLRASNETKWGRVIISDLIQILENSDSLKQFTVKELIILTNVINANNTGLGKLKTSGKKKGKLISQLMNPPVNEDLPTKKRKKTVPSLQILSSRVITKRTYPKKVMNIAFCNFLWEDRVHEWKKNARVDDKVPIFGVDDAFDPYYVPDTVESTGNFELGVYDKTHLGSNLRKALCLDKIEGISKHAWERVSRSNPSILNSVLLDVSEEGKILDQMKEKITRSLFTIEIEEQMKINLDDKEATFCRIIRESLYVADDEPGIPAIERCKKRIHLINWLKQDVDFGDFPQYGARIKGLSHILYEGLRSSNEAKLFLYALSKKGTYCVRAPNTLCSESFFSTMQEMDSWGQGVLTKEGVEKHISDFTSITAMKMKNDKPFYIRTKKDAAYPSVSTENDISVDDPNMEDDETLSCFCRTNGWIRCIIPKDHFFDTKARTRRTRKVKPFKFTNLNDPAKGDLPIRTQYSYRINETKILPSKRVGLNSV